MNFFFFFFVLSNLRNKLYATKSRSEQLFRYKSSPFANMNYCESPEPPLNCKHRFNGQ